MERFSDGGLPVPAPPSERTFWRRLGVLAIVLALVLLGWLSYLSVNDQGVPLSIVRQIPDRIDRLRPGMTEQDVWQALELGRHRPEPSAGGGPVKESWIIYSLRPGYGITLFRDGTGGVVRVRLSGEGWPEEAALDRNLADLGDD